MRLAASDAAFEADVGLAPDLGLLARAPKHVGSASLLHEVALSARARTFGAEAEEAQRSAGLVSRKVSRVAPDSRAEVVLAVEVVFGESRCRCVDLVLNGSSRICQCAVSETFERTGERRYRQLSRYSTVGV